MKSVLISLIIALLLLTSSAHAELSLSDLGFKQEDVKIDSETAKVMEIRHEKLQLHQKFGLATAAAMTATVLLADTVKNGDAKVHKIAGITTGLLYWTTAYFTWTAPRPDTIKDNGSTKIHRALSFVHVPLMAMAPVLGYLNDKNRRHGKESTGLVKAHGGVATAAYISFLAAGLTMYFDF
jgi:hypothetical protein